MISSAAFQNPGCDRHNRPPDGRPLPLKLFCSHQRSAKGALPKEIIVDLIFIIVSGSRPALRSELKCNVKSRVEPVGRCPARLWRSPQARQPPSAAPGSHFPSFPGRGNTLSFRVNFEVQPRRNFSGFSASQASREKAPLAARCERLPSRKWEKLKAVPFLFEERDLLSSEPGLLTRIRAPIAVIFSRANRSR